ncbi:hypothetical protein [Streptomyces lincolnensis]|uniref:hypothetical protein n=1 Tax=Streptomyces lincolnensis TaxID=1915 RepID=UPI00082CE3D4|nr:hypothetical protein [Streptomyces lincolnensis]QMV07881.1 hypothetical protein GJU35_20880 [Streptomyces lincolnensis]
MSSSRNTNRLAKKIRNQTSLTLSTASRLARQANVYLGSSVADAVDTHQRRLEAHMAHALASSFKDRQLNGALLGVREAGPDGQSLELTLESDMADEVLRELLPRFDHIYGGIRGVPGLRIRGNRDRVVLHDALSPAQVTVTRSDHGRMRLPSAREGEVLLWKRAPGGLSRDERQEAEEWGDSEGSADLRVRDLLMSRILRCPRLVNRTAEPHGFANCYTHHSGDLVIEWCCGDTVETLCANLLAHGIADGLPRENAIELFSRHSAHLGDRTVILNRHSSCPYGNKAREAVKYIKKGYVA